MSLAQGNNTPTRPRIEPGSPDPESDALTTRAVRPLINFVHMPYKLKVTATLMISIFNMKELSEPWILIPVSFQSADKYGSYGGLNICKWILMEATIL